ncbi:MAG: hypothetical protein M5U05_16100 [Anaerolineales bacterium]|jgi:hypothetical protein|nr:hypothetical protein [Anaerolineales bacterium]
MSNQEENYPAQQSHSQMQIANAGKRNAKSNRQELPEPETQPTQNQVQNELARTAIAPEVKERAEQGRND